MATIRDEARQLVRDAADGLKTREISPATVEHYVNVANALNLQRIADSLDDIAESLGGVIDGDSSFKVRER